MVRIATFFRRRFAKIIHKPVMKESRPKPLLAIFTLIGMSAGGAMTPVVILGRLSFPIVGILAILLSWIIASESDPKQSFSMRLGAVPLIVLGAILLAAGSLMTGFSVGDFIIGAQRPGVAHLSAGRYLAVGFLLCGSGAISVGCALRLINGNRELALRYGLWSLSVCPMTIGFTLFFAAIDGPFTA
jgi:hypothetical protein